ncbi:DUF6188 family protein [Streptomyces sp. NPDC005012]|uniref:DUF6188 family protein n=1 Tax=Streptomyces sp. NPDC005012 TaxID=3154558 RepID=UPI0033A11B0D
MPNALKPFAHDDSWTLPLRGLSVTHITIAFRLALVFEADWEVPLEGPAHLSSRPLHDGSAPSLLPERREIAAAVSLFGSTVQSAVAFRAGALSIVFADGAHLYCVADPSFEAWQVTGPDGWRFLSQPGGSLAVWAHTSQG